MSTKHPMSTQQPSSGQGRILQGEERNSSSPSQDVLLSHRSFLNDVYGCLVDLVLEACPKGAFQEDMVKIIKAAHGAEVPGVAFTLLPILTCQSVGGEPALAVPVAAAWRALHIAAHLLDDVQDGDVRPLVKHPTDESHLINVATGFIALAGLALSRKPIDGAITATLYGDFQRAVLRAASGQHQDLSASHPVDISTYFHIIGLKSGEPFALAARSGALVGRATSSLVARYETFGYNLGILVQLLDDWKDFTRDDARNDIGQGRYSLPLIYALEIAPQPVAAQLQEDISRALYDEEARHRIRQTVQELGGDVYLLAEIVRHRNRALAAIDASERARPLRDWFAALWDWTLDKRP